MCFKQNIVLKQNGDIIANLRAKVEKNKIREPTQKHDLWFLFENNRHYKRKQKLLEIMNDVQKSQLNLHTMTLHNMLYKTEIHFGSICWINKKCNLNNQ